MESTENVKSSKSWWKTALQVILFLGLGVFFIWLSTKNLSKEDVRMIFDSVKVVNNPFSWCMLFVSAFFALMADVARAVRGKIQLEPLGYRVRMSMSFYAVMVCYLANLAVPRLGEFLRCSFMQRFEHVPFQKTFGTVLTERAVDILLWLVFLVIAIGMNMELLNNLVVDHEQGLTLRAWFEQKGLSLLGNYFIYLLLGAILVIYILIRLTRRWWMRVPFLVKVRDFFVGIWRGFISIKDLPNPWRYVFWTALMWVCYFLGTYFCFFAFPFLRGIGPGAAYTLLIFSTIAFMISQGGLGSYPLIAAGILYMYGVSYTQGLAAGWIGWLLQTVVALVFGLLSLLLASFYGDKSSEQQPAKQ